MENTKQGAFLRALPLCAFEEARDALFKGKLIICNQNNSVYCSLKAIYMVPNLPGTKKVFLVSYLGDFEAIRWNLLSEVCFDFLINSSYRITTIEEAFNPEFFKDKE